jgi:hypothetical protein
LPGMLTEVMNGPGTGPCARLVGPLSVVAGKPKLAFGILTQNRSRGKLLLHEKFDILGNEPIGR